MSAVRQLEPARLERLRRNVAQLRAQLVAAHQLLTEVWEQRDWELAGYASWEAFCSAELPELALMVAGMKAPERRGHVVALAGRGLSTRAIGAPFGLSPQTVMRDLAAAGVVRTETTGRDGRTRAVATPTPAAAAPRKVVRLVDVVTAAGEPITAAEVKRRVRWSQSSVAAGLSRLAASGRLVYLAPAKRGQVGHYAPPACP